MFLDLRTIIFCNVAVTIFLAIALLFYRATQKTYAGFGLWTAGTWCLGLGYLALFERDHLVATWLSILLTNLCFSVGAVVRLDGILRFAKGRRLIGAGYAVPVAVTGLNVYFYFGIDSLAARTVIISVTVAAVSWAIARMCLARSLRANRAYVSFGVLHVLYGMVFGIRAIVWLVDPPSSLFDSGAGSLISFGSSMLLEVGIGVSSFMLNGHRVEEELLRSTEAARITLAELQKSMSEVRILAGLLPICSYCRRVRDDAGYWQQVETYVTAHSHAVFSHGICPECMNTHFPKDAADASLDVAAGVRTGSK